MDVHACTCRLAGKRHTTPVVSFASDIEYVDLQDKVRHNMLKGTPELRIDTVVN